MITILLIIASCVCSIYIFQNPFLIEKYCFNPYIVLKEKQWYRVVSHAFVHADWGHLLVNMFVLYSFGSFVEMAYSELFGKFARLFYVVLYFGGIFFAVIPSFVLRKNDSSYNSVGASGMVSSILFSSIVLNPTSPISFMFIPIDIPAYLFGILYLAYSAYMANKANDNIAHDAHFSGAIWGVVFTIALYPEIVKYYFGLLLSF
ncbi:MAG: rhomboid family intramembrane serine protease [Bacteroidota bacterium]